MPDQSPAMLAWQDDQLELERQREALARVISERDHYQRQFVAKCRQLDIAQQWNADVYEVLISLQAERRALLNQIEQLTSGRPVQMTIMQ